MLRDLRPLRPSRLSWWPWSSRQNRRIAKAVPKEAPPPSPRSRTVTRVLACVGIAAGLCGIGVGLRALLLHSGRFALTEIRVGTLRHLSNDRVLRESGLVLGRSVFALDLATAEKRLGRDPWVASVRVRRELPHTVVIDLVEREARLAVALGPLYLVDDHGEVFKRAQPDELTGIPVVTGIARERFSAEPQRARSTLRRAVEVDRTWRSRTERGVLGELHHDGGLDVASTFTAYFAHGGDTVCVRLGAPDETMPERLRRLDAVLAALDSEGAKARFIHLDQRSQLDRIAVKLADASATESL